MTRVFPYLLLLPVFLTAWAGAAFAQTPASARQVVQLLDKVREANRNEGGSLSYELLYRAYVSHDAASPRDEKTARFRQSGGRYYVDFFGLIEILITDKAAVTAYHPRKELTVQRPQTAAAVQKNSPADMARQLDSLMQWVDGQCVIERVSEETAALETRMTKALYSRYRLEYDARTYRMKRVVFYYRDPQPQVAGHTKTPPKLEIVYRNFQLNPRFEADAFALSRFGSLNGGEFRPAERFKTYRINNQLQRP